MRSRGDVAEAARRRLLPEGRLSGPMPWVIAIMMGLTVLAAAAGIALSNGAAALNRELTGRVTVQIVDADAYARGVAVRMLVTRVGSINGVRSVAAVPDEALAEQLKPWLGDELESAQLPIPSLVDIDINPALARTALPEIEKLARSISRAARVQPHGEVLGPISALMRTLSLLAVGLVLLMGAATGATVMLAARAAQASHGPTIEVLHMMGATDIQIARLFQRRLALDALFGGIVGFAMAMLILLLVSQQLAALGSELFGTVALPWWGVPALALLPIAGVALATLTARMTVVRALRRSL